MTGTSASATSPVPNRVRWRRELGAAALYTILAVVSFVPQSLHAWDTVAYLGDALESVYIVGWNINQFFRDPVHLFDAGFFYPNEGSLAFTDHRLLPSLLVAPVLWVSGNPVLASNVAIGLMCVLAAMSARYVASRLDATPLAAWTCGALYGFHSYQVSEAPRLNIISHAFIPLALWQTVVYLKTGEKKHAFFAAGWMLLQAYSSNYHLLYGCLVLALAFILSGLLRPKTTLRRIPVFAAAALAAATLYLPMALPYISHARNFDWSREPPQGVDLEYFFSTTRTNLVYGSIGAPTRLQQRGPHFIGFVSLALAGLAFGAWAFRLRNGPEESGLLPARTWVPLAAIMALLFVVLSLGSEISVFGRSLGSGLYLALYRFAPGFQLVRIPERMSLLAMFFIALLVARGLTLLARSRVWTPVVIVAMAAVPLEHLSTVPVSERIPVGNAIPSVYRWLANDTAQAIAEVPLGGEGLIKKETLDMYFSLFHLKPTVHGYSAYPPLASTLARKLVGDFPSEASLQVLGRLGADTVIAHLGREPLMDARIAEVVRAGRLRPLSEFKGPSAHVYEGTADIAYRLVPTPATPAPFPEGRREHASSWRYRTKRGDPLPAVDGDMQTAWRVPGPLAGDEFFEVTFDESLPVTGLVIRFRRDSAFPNQFKVAGLDERGTWRPLAWFDAAHALQLVNSLSERPPARQLGFDLGGQRLKGLRIMLEPESRSYFGWSIPEIEVWVP